MDVNDDGALDEYFAVVARVDEAVATATATATVDDALRCSRGCDTCCAPGYTEVTLRNTAPDAPSFLFLADESPLHRKLGVYENRG